MSTTTSIRFATRPKFPDDSELPGLLSSLGVSVVPDDDPGELRQKYTDYWIEKSRQLYQHGLNPNYIKNVDGADIIEQKRQRYTRQAALVRAPFLLPESHPPPEMTFHTFLGQPTAESNLEICASLIAKDNPDGFVDFTGDLAKFAAQQHGISFCKTKSFLWVPYLLDNGSVISAEILPDATCLELVKTIKTKNFCTTRLATFVQDLSRLADEIRDCTDTLLLIHVNQYRVKRTAGRADEIGRHRNALILNKNSGTYTIFEPHMSSAPIDQNDIPYDRIQELIQGYLTKVNPSFRLCEVPQACPYSGIGTIQQNDRLCASWAFYTGMSFILNQELITDTSVVTDAVSEFSLARMFYVALFHVPFNFQTRNKNVTRLERKPGGSLYEWIKKQPNENSYYWTPTLINYLKTGVGFWTVALDLFSTNVNHRTRAIQRLFITLTAQSWDEIPGRIKTDFKRGRNPTRFNILIPDGVTQIRDNAFKGRKGLITVTIPEGVTQIGHHAFWSCSNLRSVTIPEEVTHIEEYAFAHCTALASVAIPETVTQIGNGAFSECTGLTSVTIPEGVTEIGYSAFEDCSGLTTITIKEGVTEIGSSVFSGCSGLTTITIPEGVTQIAAYTFMFCGGLRSVTIPEGVTQIGLQAFASSGLISVTIPEGVTQIGTEVFDNCRSLRSVTIPEGVFHIGEGAFRDCWGLTSVTIPDGVKEIGKNAFWRCSGLTSVRIPEGVTQIGDYAFYNCSELTSVTIPEGVTEIGKGAFEGCSGLTLVTIPEGTKVSHSAFPKDVTIQNTEPIWVYTVAHKQNLPMDTQNNYEIQIPEGVTEISDEAFDDCAGLASVTIPEGVTRIGNSAFSYCTGLRSVTIPDGVEEIGDSSFYNCSKLMSVTIPESVTKIGRSAFQGCGVLSTVNIPNQLTEIEEAVFSGCSGLTSVTIPRGVTHIGRQAFFDCARLQSVTIPETVTAIGDGAFINCNGLTSVTIPEGVVEIGNGAFEGCSNLRSVTLPHSVTKIGREAFWGCPIGDFVTVTQDTQLGKYAFPDDVVFFIE